MWSFHCVPFAFYGLKNVKRFLHATLKLSGSRSRKAEPIILKAKSKKPVVGVWSNMTVRDLAIAMDYRTDSLFEIMSMIKNTCRYNRPDSVFRDLDVVKEIVAKAGFKHRMAATPAKLQQELIKSLKSKDRVRQAPADASSLEPRPPIVTIMGHVDHGKTTLLDRLRNSRIVDSEFGGITQHIGAFSLTLENGRSMTFLDTPGHAAFSIIRERGANVTDIVILVIAAEDGVMNQTVESINMAKNANVPIIVAINKIDKFQSRIETVKKQLQSFGIQVEDFGGPTQCVPISALKGVNINLLTEAVIAQADLLNLKATKQGLCEGVVIESKLDQKHGKLSTTIVQRGTLQKGKILVCDTAYAKVRQLLDSDGVEVKAAYPGEPVVISGWRMLPKAGHEILEVESEKIANEVVRYRNQKLMEQKQDENLDEIARKREEHNKQYKEKLKYKRSIGKLWLKPDGPMPKEFVPDTDPKVSVIIKGDVNGSVESILNILVTYRSHEKCKLDIVHFGIGAVTENDLEKAEIFSAIIYAFNVAQSNQINEMAEQKKILIKYYNVIYRIIEDLKNEINRVLPPLDFEEVIGEGVVMENFEINEKKNKINVAGVKCEKGIFKKSALFRIIRNNEIIYDGLLKSLKHVKNDVDTIKKGSECGFRLNDANFQFEKNDQVICYEMKSKPQYTDWDPGF